MSAGCAEQDGSENDAVPVDDPANPGLSRLVAMCDLSPLRRNCTRFSLSHVGMIRTLREPTTNAMQSCAVAVDGTRISLSRPFDMSWSGHPAA
jgi:hypothetical protein